MPKSSIVRLFLRVSPEIFETILFFDNQASLIAYIESAGAGEGNRQLGPCGLAREVGDYVFGEGRALISGVTEAALKSMVFSSPE